MNIEKYLILNKYILSLFGVDEFKELQERLKETSEGYDSDSRSYFINSLRSLDNVKKERLSEDTLLLYDNNIRFHVDKINRRREPKITLRYFQFLSLLFAEIFLDNFKNRKIEFLYELNEVLNNHKQQHDIEIIDEFTEDDLRKLSFWMATGSGKTLIMHINYHQFFHYKPFEPDNIVLSIQEEIVTGELEEVRIPLEFVDVLNWQRILKDIYEYKIIKGYLNLIFDRKTLESVLYSSRYKIIAPVGLFSVKQLEDLEQIQSVALLVIKKYIDNFYRKYKGWFETKHIQYGNVAPKQLKLFISESGDHFYTVQIKKTDEKGTPINRGLIRKIKELAKNLDDKDWPEELFAKLKQS